MAACAAAAHVASAVRKQREMSTGAQLTFSRFFFVQFRVPAPGRVLPTTRVRLPPLLNFFANTLMNMPRGLFPR